MENCKLSDIFDMETLQKLTDSLAAAFQVPFSIRSPEGECLVEDGRYECFRESLLKNAAGHAFYADFLASLCFQESSSPCLRCCEPLGLTAAAVPVYAGNTHVASLLAEGIRIIENDPGEEAWRRIASSLQTEEEAFLNSVRGLPLISYADFECILSLLSLLVNQLVSLGQENRLLKSGISSLKSRESQHLQEKDALEQLAEVDSMTGIYNRRKFEEVVSLYAGQKERKICMISGDANFLKLTNDIFGHDAGDLLLKTIAKIMRDLAKSNWLVARCGGDEFRVILPDTALETALDYCRRVARDCSRDKSLTLPLSVALGAAEWDSGRETLQDCFSRADVKMYQNKTALKHELRIPHYIMERLYERQILNREVVEYTTRMALEFALYLGLTKEQADEISMAAQYQDIGMAKLPESVVILGQCKTAEETSQLRMHASYGYTMARQFDELYKIADIIHCSHENWMGNSYPSGLKGEQIPLEARIIHIVSDYSDWTHPAAIGRYCTGEEAIHKLKEDGGRVYDPKLTSQFIRFLEERPE